MKRVVSGFSRVVKSSKFKKFIVVLLIFMVGALCGSLVTKAVVGESKSSQQARPSSQISDEDRAKRVVERLDQSYERAKERVKKDLEAKRIDQSQADKVNKKLEEIYNYRKENIEQLSEDKRQEWRDWLEQNDISSRYFIGVI